MEFVSHNLKYLLQLVYFTFIYIFKHASFLHSSFSIITLKDILKASKNDVSNLIISMFLFPFFSHVTVDGKCCAGSGFESKPIS